MLSSLESRDKTIERQYTKTLVDLLISERSWLMIFQRQGCILINDYKELYITETLSFYILPGSYEFLSAKAGTCHVTSWVPVHVSRNSSGVVTCQGSWGPMLRGV